MSEKRVFRRDRGMEVKINRTLIELVKGDITELATDAIVNAANTALQFGGGLKARML